MGRGRRFDPDEQLNVKKVFATFIAVVVVIMFIVAVSIILKQGKLNLSGDNKPTKYFSVYTNGKWGVIDSKGDMVVDSTYDEMVQVVNEGKEVFICTYDVNYNSGSYKTKAIDGKGNELYTEYTNVEPLENYDTYKKMWYENNLLKVQKDGKYGLIDLDGKLIVACEFEDIHTLKGYKDRIVTVKDNLYGLVDNTGAILVYNEEKTDEGILQKAILNKITMEAAQAPKESEKAKNIGKWHVSKDENLSYYTDTND